MSEYSDADRLAFQQKDRASMYQTGLNCSAMVTAALIQVGQKIDNPADYMLNLADRFYNRMIQVRKGQVKPEESTTAVIDEMNRPIE